MTDFIVAVLAVLGALVVADAFGTFIKLVLAWADFKVRRKRERVDRELYVREMEAKALIAAIDKKVDDELYCGKNY